MREKSNPVFKYKKMGFGETTTVQEKELGVAIHSSLKTSDFNNQKRNSILGN